MKTATSVLAFVLGLAGFAFAADPQARTGEEIVKSRCAQCHATGEHGAPRMDDRAAWTPRLSKGLDALVLSAIRGHGSMPARGGLAQLTDAEFRSAVVYLFNSQAATAKPAPAAAPLGPNQRVVGDTEVFLGVKPVKEGVYHVNITLRDAKTHAFIQDAQVEVGVTNPVMGGETRKLDRMTSGTVVSYGSDFRMSGNEPHVITVQVRRPDRAGTIRTTFDFKG